VPAKANCDIGITVGTSAMDQIETFLGECRADPWFQNHPGVVDRLEGVLKSYLTDEGAEWRAIWDQVLAILERTTDTPVDRCQTLALVLEGLDG
jgi:hypothetical protein